MKQIQRCMAPSPRYCRLKVQPQKTRLKAEPQTSRLKAELRTAGTLFVRYPKRGVAACGKGGFLVGFGVLKRGVPRPLNNTVFHA